MKLGLLLFTHINVYISTKLAITHCSGQAFANGDKDIALKDDSIKILNFSLGNGDENVMLNDGEDEFSNNVVEVLHDARERRLRDDDEYLNTGEEDDEGYASTGGDMFNIFGEFDQQGFGKNDITCETMDNYSPATGMEDLEEDPGWDDVLKTQEMGDMESTLGDDDELDDQMQKDVDDDSSYINEISTMMVTKKIVKAPGGASGSPAPHTNTPMLRAAAPVKSSVAKNIAPPPVSQQTSKSNNSTEISSKAAPQASATQTTATQTTATQTTAPQTTAQTTVQTSAPAASAPAVSAPAVSAPLASEAKAGNENLSQATPIS